MGCMSSSGSKSRQSVVNALSPEQTKVSQALGNYLEPFMGQIATSYPGKLVADLPASLTSAFETLNKTVGGFSDQINQALSKQLKGEAAYSPDYNTISKNWRDKYATPVMETWNRTIAPAIDQAYAGIPGGFYSSDRGKGVTNQANDFYSQYVTPQLYNAQQAETQRAYESAEAAAARVQPAASMMQSMPGADFGTLASAAGMYREQEQKGLSAAYDEWIRTQPYSSPWLGLGMSYMGIPTTTTTTKSDTWGEGLGYQWLQPGGLMQAGALV